jgi:hypothetical protein
MGAASATVAVEELRSQERCAEGAVKRRLVTPGE